MNENKTRQYGLEEKIMLLPLAVSIMLTLGGFLVKFTGNTELVTAMKTMSYYSYSWIACIAVGYCVRENKHLRVALLSRFYTKSAKKIFGVFNQILILILMIVLFVGSFLITKNALMNRVMDAKVPMLPVATSYFAPVVGFAFGIFRSIQKIMRGELESL